jgi:hypothetical protein
VECVRPEGDAAHGAYPLRYSDRPITHRMGTFVASIGGGLGIPTDGGDLGASSGLVLSYGLLNYVQIDVAPARILWAPEVEYLYPAVGLGIRFFPSSVFEVGLRTEVSIPYDDGSASQSVILPIRIHFGGVARLDLAPRVSLTYDGDGDAPYLGIPLALAFNFGPYVYFGLQAELLGNAAELDRGSIAYSARLGATIPLTNNRPLADLELRVSPFSLALDNGANVDASSVTVALSATFYLHLLN